MLNRNGVDTEDCEFRIARPDGVPQWIRRSSEVTRGPDGAANSVFTTFVDITERRATEQAMRDSEQRFAAIFRDSPAGIAITDLSGRRQFVEANLAWLNVLGFERDEVIGRTGLELNLWPDATSREAIYSAVVGPAGFWNGETQLRRIDGGVVDIALTMRRIEVGGQSFAVAISYEITDRKQAENALREAHDDLERRVADRTRELEQANLRLTESSEQLDAARNRAEAEKERAERANDAKSDFLARVSHELRTPLNAVLGFAQLLAINTQEPLTPKQLRQVEQIRKSGDYLLSLIDEILDLSKIEAGTIRVSIERVTLDSVFDHVRDMLQPLADSAGLVLAVELNPDTPPIRADRVRLVQILMNLGTNAIKYNRRGGAVRLTARPADDQMVRIEVVDTGVGIPVDRQGEVFQPFNRLGAEASRVEGTGIGLSISRRLAELMQGRLSFESRPGEGSTFVVELPIAPKTNGSAETAETQSAKNPAWAAKGTSRQFTLLYVEDNPPNIALMQELVDAVPNLRLLTAADASTGLALAHAHRPDIIVLDINLPGMNGFEILRQLKQDHRTREMPVLALSANAQPNDIDRGKAAGFAYYLTKPIDVSKFLGAIEALLKIHHGAK
jgi:PAS domain S-box-containing protein